MVEFFKAFSCWSRSRSRSLWGRDREGGWTASHTFTVSFGTKSIKHYRKSRNNQVTIKKATQIRQRWRKALANNRVGGDICQESVWNFQCHWTKKGKREQKIYFQHIDELVTISEGFFLSFKSGSVFSMNVEHQQLGYKPVQRNLINMAIGAYHSKLNTFAQRNS